MKTVGALEGKRHFSRLLSEVEAGETIIITKNGRPVARLEPFGLEQEALAADEAFEALLALNEPLGITVRALLEESRRGYDDRALAL